jgi:ADP-ribose pyrophosphatase
LVRQCRYPIGKITYELPAGKLDGKEAPLVCARRELREETGYTAGRLRTLSTFWPAPAFSNETLYIYVADRLRRGPVALDEDEFVEVVQIPFQKAMNWISSGKIKDAKTIIGLQACALKKLGSRTRVRARSK